MNSTFDLFQPEEHLVSCLETKSFSCLETKVPSHETTMEPAGSYFYIISYSIMTQRLSILIIGLIMNIGAFAQSSLPLYKNPLLSVDERVKDLLSRMTLEERSDNYYLLLAGKCTK